MIIYEHFRVAAPPATGIEWFVAGCDLLEMTRLPGPRESAYTPWSARNSEMLSVSFVRHPLMWLVGYYQQMAGKTTGVAVIDAFQEDVRGSRGNIERFVESVLTRHPSDIAKVFDVYAGSSVMKFDDFPWAPMEFWGSLIGEDHPLLKIGGTSFESYGGWLENREMRRDVVKANLRFCSQYEYY